MKLLCIQCGNYVYFECDVQVYRSVKPNGEGIILEDAVFDELNWSDCNIRDALYDNVEYVLKQSVEVLAYDMDSGHYENTLMICGRCGSRRVTPPYSKLDRRKNIKSVDEEILDNREEYKNLRKERIYADNLPVWQP